VSMKLHLLGVEGPFPSPDGATSGYLLEAGDALVSLDFGCGTLARLTALCPPEDLRAILISHWHFDHTSDLLPLIYRLEACGKSPVPVYGPADDASAIRKIVAAASCFDLHTVSPGEEFTLGNLVVKAGEARHPVPAVGWRVEYEGHSLGFTGDTNTLPSLADFYRDCDLLLADGLFPSASWAEGKPHLSAALAARLAKDAGAKALVLTHFNPLFPQSQLLSEAREIYPAVTLAVPGKVLTV